MPELVPLYLGYRLLDPNTGTVVVPDLFHLHRSRWTVRALTPGMPGSTTIGDFNILLPPPYTEEHGRYRAQYDAILAAQNKGIGLKVEGYLGDVNAGKPIVSGVITKMNLPADGPWELIGSDTLYWLQQSQTLAGETLRNSTTDIQFLPMLSTFEVAWDDAFGGWNGSVSPHSSDYNVSGFSFSASDPYLSKTALTASTSPSTAVTTTTWLSGENFTYTVAPQFLTSTVTAFGTLVPGTPGASNVAGTIQVALFSDATCANCTLVALELIQQVSGQQNAQVSIYTVSGGTVTQVAGPTTVFTALSGPFRFQLSADFAMSYSVFEVRARLNGSDPGCTYTAGANPNSGGVGIRYSFNVGGSPSVYVNYVTFHSRPEFNPFPGNPIWGTSRFARGVVTPGPVSMFVLPTPRAQTNLDVMQQLASFTGNQIRKNPGAGPKADSIDFTVGIGTDYSSAVVFEERVNVVAQGTTVQNVAEVYANDAKLQGIPGVDSGGSVVWSRIGQPGDMVLTDTVVDTGLPGFQMLSAYATAVQSRKSTPLAAVQVRVLRTPELLRANNGQGPRELDSVQVHLPTWAINRQKAQIVGYEVVEGEGEMTYWLTQFPESRMPEAGLQRLVRAADYLSTTYQAR